MRAKNTGLDTYNRVPNLESQLLRHVLVACYIILLSTFVIGILSYLLSPRPWHYTLLVSAAALISCLLILNYANHSPSRCRLCRAPLEWVVRPLLLTQKFLSMEGKKSGHYFYTRKKRGLFGGYRWVKLSNQSLACHHCRLTEEKYREVEEAPSPEELRELGEAAPASAKTDH